MSQQLLGARCKRNCSCPSCPDQLLLNRQVKGYHFLKKGEESVEGLDDGEEFKATEDAMKVLGFTEDEQLSIFRVVAGICHFGNIEVKQRPREEWASIPVTTEAEKVAHLLGINPADLVKSLLKPRIKVGNEYVQQGRTESQARHCSYSIEQYYILTQFVRWCIPLVLCPSVCMSVSSAGWSNESTRH